MKNPLGLCRQAYNFSLSLRKCHIKISIWDNCDIMRKTLSIAFYLTTCWSSFQLTIKPKPNQLLTN